MKKFRLEVKKAKCTDCDLIFLIENLYCVAAEEHVCPLCKTNQFVGSMGTITVVEEE